MINENLHKNSLIDDILIVVGLLLQHLDLDNLLLLGRQRQYLALKSSKNIRLQDQLGLFYAVRVVEICRRVLQSRPELKLYTS